MLLRICAFLALFCLLLSNPLLACSCGFVPETLCTSIRAGSQQEVVKVKMISQSPHPYGYQYGTRTQVLVLENLMGQTSVGDTLTVSSGNDGICEGSLTAYPDTMILVLKLYTPENEQMYSYPSCGVHKGSIINDTIFSASPGNTAHKIAYEDFKNEFSHCVSMNPQLNVRGMIRSWRYNRLIPDLEFQIDGISLFTDAQGTFEYPHLEFAPPWSIEQHPGFQVSLTSDAAPLRGVSTADLILMNQHILGIAPFEHAEQYLAADINNSKSITTLDMIALRRLILGLDTQFSNSSSWLFVHTYSDLPTIEDLWEENIPQQIPTVIQNMPSINLSYYNADDIELSTLQVQAIKMGDVDGSVE
jgi:hypothetical protein